MLVGDAGRGSGREELYPVRLISVKGGCPGREVAQTGTGTVASTGQGQAVAHMGLEPVLMSGRPCDFVRLCFERESVGVVLPGLSLSHPGTFL